MNTDCIINLIRAKDIFCSTGIICSITTQDTIDVEGTILQNWKSFIHNQAPTPVWREKDKNSYIQYQYSYVQYNSSNTDSDNYRILIHLSEVRPLCISIKRGLLRSADWIFFILPQNSLPQSQGPFPLGIFFFYRGTSLNIFYYCILPYLPLNARRRVAYS